MALRDALVFVSIMLAPAIAAAASSTADGWGRMLAPTPGPARVIGGPANGCLSGAEQLPPDGTGYQAIRLSRHRNYAHPLTIAFVERLGRTARAAGLEPFYVGDLSQPRGGPMTFGHAAHESGVDVDIWFNLDRKPMLAPAEREEVALPLMVLPDRSDIDPKRFGARQVRLLRLAARDPRVDRIFVHPTIKRALCRGQFGARDGDAAWLRKIRPWYGHDEHFHVRLSCPADSPACVGQPPVLAGDGCDQLDWWFNRLPAIPTPVTPRPLRRPALPEACQAVLSAK